MICKEDTLSKPKLTKALIGFVAKIGKLTIGNTVPDLNTALSDH